MKEVREKQAREEDDEVVDLLEVGGSTLLEDTTTTSPAELDQVLVAFYQNDRVHDKEGRPVTFTELLMGKDYDLTHPALDPGYVPAGNVGIAGASLANVGNLDQAPTQVDSSVFWSNIFAEQGR